METPEILEIRFKKLHNEAVLPEYAHPGDSGFDLCALEDTYVTPSLGGISIRTGLAVEIPKGYEIQIRPRSGISATTCLLIPNSPGTIDSSYRGEIMILMRWVPSEKQDHILHHYIQKGTRIAQAVVCPVMRAKITEATELSETERGEGGFGSTGM